MKEYLRHNYFFVDVILPYLLFFPLYCISAFNLTVNGLSWLGTTFDSTFSRYLRIRKNNSFRPIVVIIFSSLNRMLYSPLMSKIGKKKTLLGKEILSKAVTALDNEKSISHDFSSAMKELIVFSSIILNHLSINSSNSSLPPSKDPNRTRKTSFAKGKKRKPGAQFGHSGNYLRPVDDPHEVEQIFLDKSSLPPGKYTQVGFEKRQVFDIDISVHVKEFQAEILLVKNGEEFIASFPEGINHITQYGSSVRAMSVYLSQAQLIPLDRVRDCFKDQFNLPVSKGSISNFNLLAYKNLDYFEEWAKLNLFLSPASSTGFTAYQHH